MKDISIITVCYNSQTSIRKTIESVISQNQELFEYIIIDGGSTDNTIDIINEYKEHIDVFISETDNGIYDAMNKGIDLAKGYWINFMNSGDYFCNDKVIEDVIKKSEPKYDIMFGDIEVIKNNEKYIYKSDPFYLYDKPMRTMGFTHQSAFVKTELAQKNKFNLKYKLAADYNMFIELHKQNSYFFNLNIPIAHYDLNGKSTKHSRLHIYETLCIDNPNKIIKNYFLSLFINYKQIFFTLIKKIIYIVHPQYIIRRREKNKRFISYKSYNQN